MRSGCRLSVNVLKVQNQSVSQFVTSPLHPSFQLAYQLRMKGQMRESLQSYKRAFNLDETSVPALAGIIYCQIVEGQLSEAEQQLEFLAEVRV